MKFIVYRVNGEKHKGKYFSAHEIERILLIAFVVVFSLMIFVQTILATPSIRSLIIKDIEYEGSPVNTEEYLYKEGEITLELLNGDSDDNLKVLKNGDEVEAFSQKAVSLEVKDGDVIEIDGTGTQNLSEVGIKSCSSNMNKSCIGKKLSVFSELKSLIKIKID